MNSLRRHLRFAQSLCVRRKVFRCQVRVPPHHSPDFPTPQFLQCIKRHVLLHVPLIHRSREARRQAIYHS